MVQSHSIGAFVPIAQFKRGGVFIEKTKWQTLFQVLLPNIKPSLTYRVLSLTFAHTVGEFGVVLMIGGNIPNKTRTASIAIYDEVDALHYHSANVYARYFTGAVICDLIDTLFV